jgi:NADP-reducing hydrogenase subunit HndB
MKSLEELKKIREEMQSEMNIREGPEKTTRVVVGMATCGIAAGARPVLAAFVDEIATRGLHDIKLIQTGCIGVCQYEPIVEVFDQGKEKVTYIEMTPEKVKRVVAEHLVNHNVINEFTIGTVE